MGVNDVPGDSGKHYVMGVDLTAPFLARALAYSAGSAPARGKRKGEREVGISLAASGVGRGREGGSGCALAVSKIERRLAGCTGADPGGPKESSPFRNNLCRRRRGHFADGTGGRRTRTTGDAIIGGSSEAERRRKGGGRREEIFDDEIVFRRPAAAAAASS